MVSRGVVGLSCGDICAGVGCVRCSGPNFVFPFKIRIVTSVTCPGYCVGVMAKEFGAKKLMIIEQARKE